MKKHAQGLNKNAIRNHLKKKFENLNHNDIIDKLQRGFSDEVQHILIDTSNGHKNVAYHHNKDPEDIKNYRFTLIVPDNKNVAHRFAKNFLESVFNECGVHDRYKSAHIGYEVKELNGNRREVTFMISREVACKILDRIEPDVVVATKEVTLRSGRNLLAYVNDAFRDVDSRQVG